MNKLILLSLLLFSCTNYNCDDLEYKDGFQYEKTTGQLANGHYRCIEIRNGGGGNSEHVTECDYKNGQGIGKWTYEAQGQLIHNGEYLDYPDLKALLKAKTKAKFVKIEAWYEGRYGELKIDIFSPESSLDSLSSLSIIENHVLEICSKYKLQKIKFRQNIDNEWSIRTFQAK